MSIKETIAGLITDPSAAHKRLIEYVTAQLSQGRTLGDTLEDPYVTNRLNPMERRALLDEPEIVAAAQAEPLGEMRARLEEIAGS
ncbi:MAG: hypothetical protein FJW99_03425 [Actinobacteria bacterium]|nr:hypothetical protein [Actinomycetota bacterium]